MIPYALKRYEIADHETLVTPQLVYYQDIIVQNLRRILQIAGGPERLWPHVKSHKMAEMVKLQMKMGISRFKCATIAEAEMLADCGARDILLSYPLVGPNINRFIKLQQAYPALRFWAIGDDREQLSLLARQSKAAGLTSRVLIDLDMGMQRTGAPMESAQALYEDCAAYSGILMQGFHCYDGNHHQHRLDERAAAVEKVVGRAFEIQSALESRAIPCPVMVMGGTPSFPCHAKYPGVFLSPGTAILGDFGYSRDFPDLGFEAGAALLTRVVSHPGDDLFTLDLGYKAIASDPTGTRGVIVGLEDAEPVLQNEEHWVFRGGQKNGVPAIGALLYVIPTHICPTSALYPSVPVVADGKIDAVWAVTARNRRITI